MRTGTNSHESILGDNQKLMVGKDFSGFLKSLDAQPSPIVRNILMQSYQHLALEQVKILLELPGWPMVDRLLKNSGNTLWLSLREIRSLGNGKYSISLTNGYIDPEGMDELANGRMLGHSISLREITFSDTEIISDDTQYLGNSPRFISGSHSPQGGIDDIEDKARHIPDAAALINARMARGI